MIRRGGINPPVLHLARVLDQGNAAGVHRVAVPGIRPLHLLALLRDREVPPKARILAPRKVGVLRLGAAVGILHVAVPGARRTMTIVTVPVAHQINQRRLLQERSLLRMKHRIHATHRGPGMS
jgi:hypothetical protein